MAVYKVENGELVRIEEDFMNLVRPEWVEWDDFEEDLLRARLGFIRYDDEENVYRLFRRENVDRPEGELPKVRFIFDVNIDESNFDFILLEDSLPDFLAVMRMLEPLVNRQQRLNRELEKQAAIGIRRS